jgi:hypothetical protein
MGRRIAILQSNYIPWRGYFDMISQVDEFIIFDQVQYTKNDWRNRNLIKTDKGLLWLTIPVYHSLSQTIKETKVSDINWNIRHWKTLCTFYKDALYFDDYDSMFEQVYLDIKTIYLSEINLIFLKFICLILGIKTKITDSTEYDLKIGKTEKLIGLCNQCGADTYLSGPAAKNYLNVEAMNKEGITVEWMDYTYPEYTQLYSPFEPNVSIIDLIFNTGLNACKYL